LNIPQWNLNSETFESKLNEYTKELTDLGLIDKNSGEITRAGSIALSLIDADEVALFAGFAFSKFGEEIANGIKSGKDFLFVCSHFLKEWRCKNSGATLSNESIDCIGDEIKQVMKSVCEAKNAPQHLITPIEKVTALYVLFPDVRLFPKMTESAISSFMAHFLKKIETFQRFARLPFGDEVIENLKKSLNYL